MVKTNKKSILLAVAISLLLILSVLASACGVSNLSPWNKTLTFSKFSDVDIIYSVDGKDMKLSKICENYFDKINWESALGKTKAEVGNGANGFELIKEKLLSELDLDALSALKFEFKSSEEQKVVINGQELNVIIDNDSQYRIAISNTENMLMRTAGTNDGEFVFSYDGSSLKLPTMQASLSLELDETVLLGPSEFASHGGSLSVYINAYFK